MIVAIIILSILAIIEAGIIFLLWKVFFRTFGNLENVLGAVQGYSEMFDDLADLANIKYEKAYDGKYYPCTLFMSINFENPHTEIIADFSLYEKKKIIGLNIKTEDSLDDYIEKNEMLAAYKGTEVEENKECHMVIPKAIVYSPMEGVWTWKYME